MREQIRADLKKVKWLEGHILKILSLITSVFLWFYVVNSEPITIKRVFEIDVISPVGLGVDKMSSQRVKVTLKGARAFLKEYKEDDLNISIDLSKRKLKKQRSIQYFIKDSDILLPFGVDVVQLEPERITINFDKLINKKIPIKSNIAGSLPPDLKLIHAKISPGSVSIEGPRSVMKTVGVTKTKLIDISGLTGNGEIDVELEELPHYVHYMNKEKFKLKYDIRPKKANMNLKNIPINFISTTHKFKPSKRAVSIDVLAPEGRSIRSSEVKVYAEIPAKKKGNFNVKLRAILPEGVHLLQINPETIRVRRY
ncbi:YbbR-like domain-containing protein [Bacteriovorax sp. DB6_IX]|uniref:CdaR family protein n=1 Tax=Bacteriovorax sp. DB6_IX TaxID=1353530 RepID=UPI00038A2C1A|nr:CdaR family protein [Bacteriovorax sp. DB6_IX]EQC51881.1 YbbR-like protein [Bacteriovorax sp. DB6_IX]